MRFAAASHALRPLPAFIVALAVGGCGVGSPLSLGKGEPDGAVAVDVNVDDKRKDAGLEAAVDKAPDNRTPTGSAALDAGTGSDPEPSRHPCGTGLGCDPSDLGGETCESLGFGSGRLLCDPLSCTFEVGLCTGLAQRQQDGGVACGSGGACDPTNLGGQSCESLGMGVGLLFCDPETCTFDTSLCAGGMGVGGMMGSGGGMMGGDMGGGNMGADAGAPTADDFLTLLQDLLGGLLGGLFGGVDAGMGNAGANDAG